METGMRQWVELDGGATTWHLRALDSTVCAEKTFLSRNKNQMDSRIIDSHGEMIFKTTKIRNLESKRLYLTNISFKRDSE